MSVRSLFLLKILFTLSSGASAAGFPLGVDYTQFSIPTATQIRTDKEGCIYVLQSFAFSSNTPSSTVVKLTSDGKTAVWRNMLAIAASSFAVDPNGNVYVTPLVLGGPVSVSKLHPDGSGLAWTKPTGITVGFVPSLTTDTTGRIYVAGFDGANGHVVRLSADGDTQDYSRTFAGMPASIAVDAAGSAYVTGHAASGIFLTRLNSDGSAAFYSSASHPSEPSVAIAPNGGIVVYSGGVLKRFDSNGTLVSSKTVANFGTSYPGVVLDAAGNAYIGGSSAGASYPVKNTLATCGTELLSVIAPDDTVLQTTYVPGAWFNTRLPMAIGRNSTVLLAPRAFPGFVPSREGPFIAGENASLLVQLATQTVVQTLPLACAVNALSFQTGANSIQTGVIAPGEIVTLFGNGLGPKTGIAGSATPQSPFPTKLGEVQATVNGTLAPLLWVQNRQINLIVPWGTAAGAKAEVCVIHSGVNTNCLSLDTALTAPGVASVDGTFAAAMNQDGTLNSSANPAPAGSVVAVWATGLGPVTPSQGDGAIVTNTAFNTAFSFVELNIPPIFKLPGRLEYPEMTYAGPAPLIVSGVTQINFRADESGPYTVVSGGKRSQPFSIHIARTAQ